MKRGFFNTYTAWIIIANVIIFFLLLASVSIFGEQTTLSQAALQPSGFFQGQGLWTIFTSMFSHVWSFHLLANMISLFFIGLFVERLIGKKRFLAFYIAAGLFAGLFFAVLSFLFGGSEIGARIFGNPEQFGLGASGAIFGLLGLLAVLTPKNKVYLIAGPLVAIIANAIVSSAFAGNSIVSIFDVIATVYVFVSIFAMFSFNSSLRKIALPIETPFWALPLIAIVPLAVTGIFINLPIANTAHLGGLIAGLAYGYSLKKKYPRKTKVIARYFAG